MTRATHRVRHLLRRYSLPLALAALVPCATPTTAAAQTTDTPAAPTLSDPIARSLFEPELIMTHRRAIALTDEQRDAISRLIRELQGEVVSLQWDLQDEAQSLGTELDRSQVDLDRALDRMGKVMQLERKLKEAHLTLLVRIKNVLRPEQQATLKRLRGQSARAP